MYGVFSNESTYYMTHLYTRRTKKQRKFFQLSILCVATNDNDGTFTHDKPPKKLKTTRILKMRIEFKRSRVTIY